MKPITKRLLIAAPVLAALAAVPALAGAFGGAHRGHRHDPEKMIQHVDHVMDKVDATDEQKTSVRGILEGALPTMKGFHEEAGELKTELKGVFAADTVDRVALEDVRLDMVDLADRASQFFLTTLADAADVLTPEQRQELQALREERRARHMERRGRGGPDGSSPEAR